MNKYYAQGLAFFVALILTIVFMDALEKALGGPAVLAAWFSLACFSLSKFVKAWPFTKANRKARKPAGTTDKGLRIFLVKHALRLSYENRHVPFSRTREYHANYFNKESYQVRKERNSSFDIVCSNNSISTYEYSPDMRETPCIIIEHTNLKEFLKACVVRDIEANLRPGFGAMLNQIKTKGKIDHLAVAEKAKKDQKFKAQITEKSIKFVESSIYFGLLSRLSGINN